jgi:hypothetical protein
MLPRSFTASEAILALLVLTGLVSLVVSSFAPASLADGLTYAAVGFAGLGVLLYVVVGWRAGAMGTSMGMHARDAEARATEDPEE